MASDPNPLLSETNSCSIDQEVVNVSALPKARAWIKDDYMYQFEGFWYSEKVIRGIIAAQKKPIHELLATDHSSSSSSRKSSTTTAAGVLLASYPKSGSTWLKAILYCILTRTQNTDFSSSSHPILNNSPHELVLSVELDALRDPTTTNPNIPKDKTILSTHLPFKLLPDPLKHPTGSLPIVYIYRNPKDVLVSQWHFRTQLAQGQSLAPLSWDEATKSFCEGKSPLGPWSDHLLSYLNLMNSSGKTTPPMFLVSYEDLQSDPCGQTRKLAEFLGCPFLTDEENEGVVEKIVRLCSFETMKNSEGSNSGVLKANVIVAKELKASIFFREGKVGDHVNYLTPEMIQLIDQTMEDKLKGTGLSL